MTRNSKTLESFVKFCDEHPDQRFWQALRNWSGYPFIFINTAEGGKMDTFYIEERRHDDKGIVFPAPPDWGSNKKTGSN